jgi:hypothetical protein
MLLDRLANSRNLDSRFAPRVIQAHTLTNLSESDLSPQFTGTDRWEPAIRRAQPVPQGTAGDEGRSRMSIPPNFKLTHYQTLGVGSRIDPRQSSAAQSGDPEADIGGTTCRQIRVHFRCSTAGSRFTNVVSRAANRARRKARGELGRDMRRESPQWRHGFFPENR